MLRYKTLSYACVLLWMFSVQQACALSVNPESKKALRKSLKDYSASRSQTGSVPSPKRSSKTHSSSSSGAGSYRWGKEQNKLVYTLPEPRPLQSAVLVEVEDGDTIRVLLDDTPFTVTLYGIDSPERTQPHGMQAVQALTKLLKRKKIQLQIYDTDREQRRCLALVSAGKRNVNELLVKGGHAWVKQEYCYESFCSDWRSFQQKAKDAKKGIWSYSEAIAPWLWRAMSQEQRRNLQQGYNPVENGLRSRYGKDTTIIGR
ncbi:thermonuclease family protein [Candidatus Electrothrix sp.]|uniref:thermonuclease family protein n=1 Tax=Candidatus Electrothrix sp. TaxID=2170559 RepID=UPI004056D5EC